MKTEPETIAVNQIDTLEGLDPKWRKPASPMLAAVRRIAFWYGRWLQRQDLAELDDHILRDIGISPREVKRECAKPFWQR